MKQITIYDLLPLLKSGYVAMDDYGRWYWYEDEPTFQKFVYDGGNKEVCLWNNSSELSDLSKLFNIAPFNGDLKDSLIKVEHKEEE